MSDLVRLRGRDVFGRLRDIELTEQGSFSAAGSQLEQRLVVVKDRDYVFKWVSRAAGSRRPELYELLDNEVRAGTRLGQVYAQRYPSELARLVAYNVDAEEPFVLLCAYAGVPAGRVAARFTPTERRAFQVSMLSALHLISEVGVVHGALSLDSLRWDGNQAQLVNFEAAERVGEQRRAAHAHQPGWQPREAVDPRDDVFSAATLIRNVTLGTTSNGSRPDRGNDPEWIRALLDPVFDNPVECRPHARDLLGEMRAAPPPAYLTDPEAALVPGQRQFDAISLRKRSVAVPSAAVPARRAAAWRNVGLAVACVFLLAVAFMIWMVM